MDNWLTVILGFIEHLKMSTAIISWLGWWSSIDTFNPTIYHCQLEEHSLGIAFAVMSNDVSMQKIAPFIY